MSYILDLVLAAIVVLCGWRGFRTGIINGLCGIIAVIIAIYGANLLASAFSGEFNSMIKPFATGVVDGALSDAVGLEDEDQLETVLDKEQLAHDINFDKLDVYDVTMDMLESLGITGTAAASIADEVALRNSRVGTQMTEDVTEILCGRVSYVATFTVAFTLISIIFAVIGNVFDLAFGIPGHENLNHITGAALGVIKGIMILLVLTSLFRYLGIFISHETVDKTWILKPLMESNRLASILGI